MSLLILTLFFISCGDQAIFPSIEFDSCFADYTDKQELTERVDQLSQSIIEEQPNYPIIAIVGCMNYQLGKREEAEQFLNQVFYDAKDVKTKGMAAAALGLIYLKERRHSEIKPYIEAASKHHLGRWMIVLHYIDYYRETDNLEHLQNAIQYMERKNKSEGTTDASERFLERIQDVHKMAENCSSLDTDASNPSCRKVDFREEKISLFAHVNGFLTMLLKEEPFNIDQHDNDSDSSSAASLAMN